MKEAPEKVHVNRFEGVEPLCQAAAAALLESVGASSRLNQESFSIALSGGRIARVFFTALVEAVNARAASQMLERVHFFWADERCVPAEDPESNFRIAAETLFQPLNIRPDQIHRIRGEDPPHSAAELASMEMCQHVPINPKGFPVLDLLILGMGEDGHVASLFPGEPAGVMGSAEVYRAVTGPKPPPNRVTLGYDTIITARQAWVLVAGAAKESALRASVRPNSVTPLGRVLRQRQSTTLFTDIQLG